MALGTDGLLTVVGDVDTITDDKAAGTLTVRLSDKLVVGDRVYAPVDQTVQLNPNDGTFSIKLPPVGDTGVTYRFELVVYAYVGGQREHFEEAFNTVLTAEDGDENGIVQYHQLAPVATPGVPQTFLTRTAADSRYLLKTEIPDLPSNLVTTDDLTGLATSEQVEEAVTGLASTTYVDEAVENVPGADPATIANSPEVRETYLPGLGQFELQPMFVTGHSWQAVDTNATPGARWYQRVARRIGITGTPTNKAQSGRTVQDIAIATLAGANGWTPRTKALVGLACTINDVTIFDGSAAARRGYQWAWRALLAQLTANAAVACNTTTFVYSSGWTSSAISASTGQASNTNSTGGRWFRTTTAGSYFEFTVTGDAVDVFLVARAAGSGLCTFTMGGATVGTLNLTQPSAQDTVAVAQLRGLGAGVHTVRGTLTSGASLTVDSIRIPSTDPVPGIVLGEPNVIPTNVDHASYLADVEILKGDLAQIVASFPTFRYVDLNGPGWDTATMLTEDGKHPNDAGCAYIASRCMPVLAALPYSRGLNVLGTTAVPSYTSPAGPAIPANGQDGIGTAGGGTPTAPGQVTGLAVAPGDAQLTASWAQPSGTPTDYVIQYRTSSGPGAWQTFADGTSTATAATITGLTNGTSYDVQVAAVNATGTGTYSAFQTATPVAAGAAVTVADDFNRANAALAGSSTTTGAKTWTASGTAVHGIVSNAVKVTSGSGNGVSYVDTGFADGDVQATLTAVSGTVTSMISGIAMRYVDDSNYLSVQLRRNTSASDRVWSLVQRVDNVATVLASSELLPAAGAIVKAEMRGSTVRVLVNGAEVIPATTVSLLASAKHGLYGNGTDTVSTWDNWSAVSA